MCYCYICCTSSYACNCSVFNGCCCDSLGSKFTFRCINRYIRIESTSKSDDRKISSTFTFNCNFRRSYSNISNSYISITIIYFCYVSVYSTICTAISVNSESVTFDGERRYTFCLKRNIECTVWLERRNFNLNLSYFTFLVIISICG